MARDSSTFREECPFWSAQAMNCQLCREGLFIPLNDHIKMYCRATHYPQCPHFLPIPADQLHAVGNYRQNHRRYQRVAAGHGVTVELEPGRNIGAHASAHRSAAIGRTLDLSKGGMGLILELSLQESAVVSFAFEDSFPQSIQTGQGRIVWCRKRMNTYQAGISFANDRFIETMGLYLGLITSILPAD